MGTTADTTEMGRETRVASVDGTGMTTIVMCQLPPGDGAAPLHGAAIDLVLGVARTHPGKVNH